MTQAPAGLESAAPPRGQGLRFPALDGLRAVAALAVVTTHVGFQTGRTNQPGPVGWLLARGDFGVTLFFLLSGFLLFRPFAGGPVALPRYLRRRALRVLPVYWLAVVLAFLLLPGNEGRGAGDWWRHLLLVQIYRSEALPDGLTQMWSLCTEVAFYLALPVLALLFARLRKGAVGGRSDVLLLLAMVAVGVGWTAASTTGWLPSSAHLWLPAYADWFALGMGLAVLHVRTETGGRGRVVQDLAGAPGTCLSIGVPLLLLASTPLGGPRLLEGPSGWEAVAKHVLYGASAFWLLLPAVFHAAGGSPWTRVLSSRPLHLLGLISYSVFALHLLVLHFAFRLLDLRIFTGRFGTVWLVTVAGSVAVSAVSYLLVERPAQRLGHRPASPPRRRPPG